MSQIKPEEMKGLIRKEVAKGDEKRDKPYTAIMNDGSRVDLDASEAKSLQKRLDKDRSRMEKEGTRDKEREPTPSAPKHRQVTREETEAFLRNNFRRER